MKKNLCIAILLTGLGLFVAPSAMALSIGFAPPELIVNVGDKIDVDIVVTELADSEILSAYDLDVLFDPDILLATGVSFGSGLNGDIPPAIISAFQIIGLPLPQEFVIDNGKGEVEIRETSLMIDDELASRQANLEPFTLATIFFDVIGPGTSPLSLSLDGINNIVEQQAVAVEKDTITLGVGKIAPVPEPATILLLGAGLAGLAGFRRKKFNRKTH